MKEKIIYLIVGVLVGAILTTGVFLIINKNQKPKFDGNREQMMRNFDPNNIPNGVTGEGRMMRRGNTTGTTDTTNTTK